MADNSKKVSELPTAANVASTDRVLVLRSPSSNASVRTVTVANLRGNTTIIGFLGIDGSTITSNATGFISVNSSVITSNNTSFVGSVSAANVVSNAQLTSNLTNYQTSAGLSANIAAYLPTYTGIVNGASHTVGASFTANSTVVTTTGNFTGNTNDVALGYRDVPQNFTNTSFTLAANDAGKHVLTQNAGSSTQTITIANNTSVAFQTGAAITIVVQSTGTVAVANGAGVTMYLAGNSTAKSTVTLNSYSMATLLKIGTDTWMISGTGAT